MTQTLPEIGFRVEPADYQADFKDLRAIRTGRSAPAG